ncbi:MAG TPA: radical SAM protein, partial [Candidatus Acidoferrales bacterium]|nr:radical SAM protein [Candidatus Acidoferrales bacterium]
MFAGPETSPDALAGIPLVTTGGVKSDVPFKAVLINPYELGRQPFALAEPAAWLKRADFEVACIDLSLQKLDPLTLAGASLVALYVGMHTATRIAVEAIPRIKVLASGAHLCVYGLYAPMNEVLLRGLGIGTVLGGEFEPGLLSLAERLRSTRRNGIQSEPLINLSRIEFLTPDRTGLPPLARYAHLQLPDGSSKVVGFAEGSRGCKHLCRHCPVVPVYQGKFRIVPVDVVMADIRSQVAMGAQHISFGDPDFFNGPTHALKLVTALHAEFPGATFDAVIKVQHLIDHAELLAELKRCGCLFITAAVEAVDDRILEYLDKNHTAADFGRAVALLRQADIAFAPTFVAFTPWTTLEGYVELLQRLIDLDLVESVPPIQLC